jgi:hypothetical protein
VSERRGTVDDDTQEFDPFPFEQGEKDDRGEDGDTAREEGRREEEQREKVRRGIDSQGL